MKRQPEKPHVWVYWQGPMPPYIELCIRTVARHCAEDCNLHIVGPATFGKYVQKGILHDNFYGIEDIGIASDPIRAALLTLYGGFWIDADTVMLRSPRVLFDKYRGKDFVYSTWTKPPRRTIAGYCYARVGSPVAAAWLANINTLLSCTPERVGWCVLGEQCLGPAVKTHPNTCLEIDRKTWLPVDIDAEVHRFFEPGRVEDWVTSKTVMFGLNHSWFVSRRPDVTLKPLNDIVRGELLFNQVMFRAAQECAK